MEDLHSRKFKFRKDDYPTSGSSVFRFGPNDCWSWFIWSDRTAKARIEKHATNYKNVEDAKKCADEALLACGYKLLSEGEMLLE